MCFHNINYQSVSIGFENIFWMLFSWQSIIMLFVCSLWLHFSLLHFYKSPEYMVYMFTFSFTLSCLSFRIIYYYNQWWMRNCYSRSGKLLIRFYHHLLIDYQMSSRIYSFIDHRNYWFGMNTLFWLGTASQIGCFGYSCFFILFSIVFCFFFRCIYLLRCLSLYLLFKMFFILFHYFFIQIFCLKSIYLYHYYQIISDQIFFFFNCVQWYQIVKTYP